MNKEILVVYTSKYGTTKQYAEWIAEALCAELAEAKSVDPKTLKAHRVVYGGGLYAGGIAGVKLVTDNPCNHLVVFTVGLAEPSITDYSAIINKNIPPEVQAGTKIFHLRGGIDYKSLGPVHKAMMAMMKSIVKKKAASQQDAENEEFLKTYGSKVDFSQRQTIEPLISYVKNIHP